MKQSEIDMRIRFNIPDGLFGEKIAEDLRKSLESKYGVSVFMNTQITLSLGPCLEEIIEEEKE